MKTVRCNTDTFRKLMKAKHPIELERMDVVNMSDVLDVVLWRYEELQEALQEADSDSFERVMGTKFRFQDTADVAAQPILDDEVEEDEEDEAPRPKKRKKKKPASKAAARKRRSVED